VGLWQLNTRVPKTNQPDSNVMLIMISVPHRPVQFICVYLLIYGGFHDALRTQDYIASSGRTISE
jgi:hypothetical protein